MSLKHQSQIDKFYEWREQNKLLAEELEVKQSKKLNLMNITDDEVDSVIDHAYDDLFKLK